MKNNSDSRWRTAQILTWIGVVTFVGYKAKPQIEHLVADIKNHVPASVQRVREEHLHEFHVNSETLPKSQAHYHKCMTSKPTAE
jgi:hypothetical protein